MNLAVLAVGFLVVMAAALACFIRAYATRKALGLHKRFAIIGTLIDVIGTVVVVVTGRMLGWKPPAAFPTVALVHRGFAYLSSAMLAVQVVTGARRHPLHNRLGPVFLAVYAITYGLALWAYAPWW